MRLGDREIKLASLRLLTAAAIASLAIGCAAPAEEEGDASEGEDAFSSVTPLGPEPQKHAPRHPMVIVSGFATSPRYDTFLGLPAAYESYGQKYFVANLPPYDSAENRGKKLAEYIDTVLRDTGAVKVNILAHSMGGLDSRVAITKYLGTKVASVTTISSPHGGSSLGDLGLHH